MRTQRPNRIEANTAVLISVVAIVVTILAIVQSIRPNSVPRPTVSRPQNVSESAVWLKSVDPRRPNGVYAQFERIEVRGRTVFRGRVLDGETGRVEYAGDLYPCPLSMARDDLHEYDGMGTWNGVAMHFPYPLGMLVRPGMARPMIKGEMPPGCE